ncbi:hypothetical protein GF339_02880 [candidate division KSB3 bacterium]|uniref:Uncharacterized protein n=1 Tax=candidate division KSB3 bacterium TaxID=2044937 RepID=A0A9D5JSL6_9BACT|nr:hypothetical protein [candidate division KSB3 bacterium]MBD3323499.1 hypothetical protein [candidate division KSB3 bacterium]
MLEGFSGGLVVAIVDFFMVFLVLTGLAGAIVGLRKLTELLEQTETIPMGGTPVSEPAVTPPPAPTEERPNKADIAAILAAIQEFTSLPVGSFTIDSIESLETPSPHSQTAESGQQEAHIAAILAAVQDFTSLPVGSFTIDSIIPLEAGADQAVHAAPDKAHIAAMAAALYEFTAQPAGTLRITRVTPLGRPSNWKIAGRLELMGVESLS